MHLICRRSTYPTVREINGLCCASDTAEDGNSHALRNRDLIAKALRMWHLVAGTRKLRFRGRRSSK